MSAVTQGAAPASGALLYRINVAEAKLGVSRSTIYRLVKDGELELVKIGKRSSGITADSIDAMIERNKAARRYHSGIRATRVPHPQRPESG